MVAHARGHAVVISSPLKGASPERRRVPRLGYRPELDGLRAVAIVAVMAFHLPGEPLTGGFLGVDLFFVLSGFLITTLLVEEFAANGRISLGAFYMRRALRLLPAVVALLAVLWVAVLVLGARFRTTPAIMASTTAYTLGYVANWALALNLAKGWPTALDHLWSLSVEEQFYLAWPLILAGLLTRRVSRAGILRVLAIGIAGITAWRVWLSLHGASFDRLYYATDTRADELLIGCAAAMLFSSAMGESRSREWIAKNRLALALGGGVIFCLGLALLHNTAPSTYRGVLTFAVLGAAALCLGVAAGPVPGLTRVLQAKPVVWIGRISYGLYLWHFVVFYAVARMPHPLARFDAVWGALGAIVCAAASFYLVEQPCLRLKRRFERARVEEPGSDLAPVAAPVAG